MISGVVRKLATLAALALLATPAQAQSVAPETLSPLPNVPLAPVAPPLTSALALGVTAGPSIDTLDFRDKADLALLSFRESCPRLLKRSDASGLTRPEDWTQVCALAANWPEPDAARFFALWFEPVMIGDGKSFVTGYYEPEIAGVRTREPGYDVPVYAVPSDLVRGWPADLPEEQRTGPAPQGRFDETGAFVPYYDRAAIDDGALAGKNLEIAWAADPVEFFFLQIQGSGRLRAPDGSVMRIGYAGQNGRDYVALGALMRDRGLIGEGEGQYSGSMQGVMRYLREHPEDGKALMRQNQSWVFFREITGDGPIGALSVPVRPRASVAADPAFVPLGAPVWLDLDRTEASGLWIAQDTGGAIKGANRFDSFWGAGEEARTIAGGMSGRGRAVLLLPLGTLARLNPPTDPAE
ncbi:MAG: rane-bound lytic murein transglycosylase precursor [Novosphingobium sp.]|nr:rane-bound lytic murein transglycosylase precursor [Novosphingobium sp.]